MRKRLLVAFLVLSLFLSFWNVALAEAQGLRKIRVALWWIAGDDPTYIDPATGEHPDTMPTALREARLKARNSQRVARVAELSSIL